MLEAQSLCVRDAIATLCRASLRVVYYQLSFFHTFCCSHWSCSARQVDGWPSDQALRVCHEVSRISADAACPGGFGCCCGYCCCCKHCIVNGVQKRVIRAGVVLVLVQSVPSGKDSSVPAAAAAKVAGRSTVRGAVFVAESDGICVDAAAPTDRAHFGQHRQPVLENINICFFYLFFHRACPGSVVDAQAAGDHGGAAAIHAAGAAPAMRNAEPALRRVRRAAGADADPVASVLAAHPAGSGV